jgi:glucosamine-phosphate N-acetyltransferase
MKFVIRDLQGPDISKGLLETLRNLADVQLTLEQAGEVHRRRLRTGVRSYVAWSIEAGQVIGTVSLLIEQKFIHHGGMVAHIEDVSVRVGYEKMGVGTALVRHAKEQAQKIGCYKVILNCAEHLVPFYESLGFRRHVVQMRTDSCNSSSAEEKLECMPEAQARSHCQPSDAGNMNPVRAADLGGVLPLATTH